MLADVEDGEDVGMIERGDGASFLLEANQAIAFEREGFGKDFQRDFAAEARIAGPRHFAHSTGAERRDDFVGAKLCGGRQRHVSRGL